MIFSPTREDRYFLIAIVVAALLHAGLWSGLSKLIPKMADIIPVQMLQVKLGLEEEEDEFSNSTPIPQALEKLVQEKFAPNSGDFALSERAAKRLEKQFSNRKNLQKSLPQQFVRERESNLPQTRGSSLGNSKESKTLAITAYAQTLALWVQQYKTYPEKARAGELEGDAVIRIRIDRQGNIHYVSFRQKSGHAVLDNAVLDMVQRANPVPAVPDNYPVKDAYLEFLIPISFKLGKT